MNAMNFDAMDFSDLENLDLEQLLAVDPKNVEVSSNMPKMVGIFVLDDISKKVSKKDDGSVSVRVNLAFECREAEVVNDPSIDPNTPEGQAKIQKLVGRKQIESFDIASDFGLGALVSLLCRIAGVDATDEEARAALGGTVFECVNALKDGALAFRAKIDHNKGKGGAVYANFTRDPKDFALQSAMPE